MMMRCPPELGAWIPRCPDTEGTSVWRLSTWQATQEGFFRRCTFKLLQHGTLRMLLHGPQSGSHPNGMGLREAS